ncbi:segregation/condensation protein A, partial [Staphylococcus condimenti]
SFDQVTPLGERTGRWTGAEDGEVDIHDEFDGAPPGDDDAPMASTALDEPEEDQ